MPIFRLTDRLIFPDPELAEPEGLLAVGGDLSPERLLLAYSMGIFPWFNEGEPILWWSPDPRCILEPGEVRVSRRLARFMKSNPFRITFDQAFHQVVSSCADLRRGQGQGTWITASMAEAYGRLHELGYAHSVEAWQDDFLAGGLYGVALGRCFFGESMFFRVTNASKVVFCTLARRLAELGYRLIDCQISSQHLFSLGAAGVTRREFLRRLAEGEVRPSRHPSRGVFPA
ncbi:MAG: leucyl/phenylalanyl-tRNA--protein transferase [Syntrophotaleaceae bacterium]